MRLPHARMMSAIYDGRAAMEAPSIYMTRNNGSASGWGQGWEAASRVADQFRDWAFASRTLLCTKSRNALRSICLSPAESPPVIPMNIVR